MIELGANFGIIQADVSTHFHFQLGKLSQETLWLV